MKEELNKSLNLDNNNDKYMDEKYLKHGVSNIIKEQQLIVIEIDEEKNMYIDGDNYQKAFGGTLSSDCKQLTYDEFQYIKSNPKFVIKFVLLRHLVIPDVSRDVNLDVIPVNIHVKEENDHVRTM
jgi:hypothetical protein